MVKKSILSILSLLMLFSLIPQQAFGATKFIDENSSFEEANEVLMKYVSTTEEGVFFNVEAAINEGESEFVIETGKMLNELNDMYNPSEEDVVTPLISLPIWGNWCGPGYGGGPTKDHLDAACKEHDIAYGREGYFSCTADARLIARIGRDYNKMKTLEKMMAQNVVIYFTAQMAVNCR
ncbi:hypothetical protein [Shouchella lehensis]|uniref:Phospholipase n=1 Tax=Shouchella lehensis TaxID=300825 RepID=A0A4Y7WJ93_9BACI|nr:hypothetical protein [Shouchella lehensis]TES48098.1 hypothetical protein E2L03_13265 [Shouchella lehensis]